MIAAPYTMKVSLESRRIRHALLVLSLTLAPLWMQAGGASPAGPQQSTGSALTLSGAGATGSATGIPLAVSPESGTGGVATDDGREDLTVFFAIGVLVDDAIIYVENVYRSVRENAAKPKDERRPFSDVVAAASSEIRSPIAMATPIVIVVFVHLFFLGGVEGRMLKHLGLAYVI